MASERDADVGGGGGFSNTPFAGGDNDNSWGDSGELGFAVVLEEGSDANGRAFSGVTVVGFMEGFEGKCGTWVERVEGG